jgi:hypothetical protein
VIRVGPVVVQALPDAARSLGDVGVAGSLVVHPQVIVVAVGEQLRAARPEVREPGNELLGSRGGHLGEVNPGHVSPILEVVPLLPLFFGS